MRIQTMNSSRLLRIVILALVFAATISGCIDLASWRYTPNSATPSSIHVPLTLAVEYFKDQRGDRKYNHMWLCAIPAILLCTAEYDRPDANNGFLTVLTYNFRPSDDLANAVATELRQATIFREVDVTEKSLGPGAQLVLRGVIENTEWRGEGYAYLLGLSRGLPILLGLPAGSVYNTLKLHLELLKQSNQQVLWRYDIEEHYSKTEGMYYNLGRDFDYPEMLREGIKPAIESLRQFIASQPASYWDAMAPAGTATHAAN